MRRHVKLSVTTFAIAISAIPLALIVEARSFQKGAPVPNSPTGACLASAPRLITALLGGWRLEGFDYFWEGTTRFEFDCSAKTVPLCSLCFKTTLEGGITTSGVTVWAPISTTISSTAGSKDCGSTNNQAVVDLTFHDLPPGPDVFRVFVYASPFDGTTPCETATFQGATSTYIVIPN